jgi:hypothetical protein
MKLYLNNLILRLKQFSENLDKKEIFIEIPWIVMDNNLTQQKFIFKRNGDLIIALNGQVTIGKWEYLATAKSLLINRIQDMILLNQIFIDPAVMVLKKDSLDDYLILVNENLLPNLEITEYLKKLYYEKNKIIVIELKTGEYLELHNYQGSINGNYVTIEGESPPDCFVHFKQSEKKYIIEDSRIVKVLVKEHFDTNKGKIIIEQQEFMNPSKGDFVFQNDIAAPDGKYRLGFMHYITVEKGLIIKS